MTKEDKNIIHPDHYTRLDPQPWDVIIDWRLDGIEAPILKYLARAGYKEGEDKIKDLGKSLTYTKKLREAWERDMYLVERLHLLRWLPGEGPRYSNSELVYKWALVGGKAAIIPSINWLHKVTVNFEIEHVVGLVMALEDLIKQEEKE